MTLKTVSLPRPAAGDHGPAAAGYVAAAPVLDDAIKQLTIQRDVLRQQLSAVPPAKAAFRYADDKWTVREVVGHLADAERVFAYRLLRIGRGDQTPLSGFDENGYVPAAAFEVRPLADVVEEWIAVRNATLALVKGMPADAWSRWGTANAQRITAAAIVYIIFGHVEHHRRLLVDRYGIG
jgi:hypothetical protein